jgi:hypothetical protein
MGAKKGRSAIYGNIAINSVFREDDKGEYPCI